MTTRRRGKKGIGTGTQLGISIGIFVAVVVIIATQTDVLEGPVITSIDDIFTLQSVGDIQTVKCFIKFELRTFAQDGSLIKSVSSSGDVDANGNIISGRVFEGDFLSLADREVGGKTISRWEIQPEIRCDKPNQTSGQIGWRILPSHLSVLAVVYDPNFNGIDVGAFSSETFSLSAIHDNFAHKLPTINIPASAIEAKAPKRSYDYDSRVVFVLGGGINLQDDSRPSLTFTHFVSLSPSPVVTSQHQIVVKSTSTQPINLPKETIEIYSFKRISDNGDLLDFTRAINSKSTVVNERSVEVIAWLDEFRGVSSNSNEEFPRASLFCLPDSDPGGVCQTLSQIGQIKTMEKLNPSATGASADFFKTTLIVPQNTPAGTYGISVFSDDRDQVGSRGFLIVQLLSQSDCANNEELINNRCVAQEIVTCQSPLVRDANTNTCVENPNQEPETCASPLVSDGMGGCKSAGTDSGTTTTSGGICNENENEVGGACVPKTTEGDGKADAYFTYITNLAGDQLSGTINQEGVFSFEPQAIIGIDLQGKPRNLVEIRVTPTLNTNDLGSGVQIKSGTTKNTARADLLVNGQIALENFNIDYPQRTFGQVASNGLATFGLIGIQPAEIIDDASKRIDSQGRSSPLVFLNNDKLVISLTFSNEFEFSQGGKTFNGVISPMNAQFPFTFIQGTVTGGENEGCGGNEVFSPTLNQCVPVSNACGDNQTLIGGHCVDNTNPNPDGTCNSNETKIGGKCVPKVNPNPDGSCTAPLVKNPDTTVGGCIVPSSDDNPKCPTGTTSLFNPACLFPIPDGNPDGNDSASGTCAIGETAEQCQTRLQAAGTPIISGGTLTIAIVGFVVLVIGIVIVAVLRGQQNQEQ